MAPSDIIPAPCIYCGRDAQPQVHHGREDDSSQGKGMGGTSLDWPEHSLFDICDEHHHSLHAKRWSFRPTKGMIEVLAPGEEQRVIGRRGLVLLEEEVCDNCHHPRNDHWGTREGEYLCDIDGCLCAIFEVDNLRLSDIALAKGWADADSEAVSAFQKQCEIADALRQRYAHTTEKWYERAAEILGSYRGKHVHPRRVYERVHLMATFGPTDEHPKGRWEDMEKLGMTVALAVAKLPTEDRPAALEKALDLNADFTPALQIAAQIKGDSVAESATTETHACPDCGAIHTKKGD